MRTYWSPFPTPFGDGAVVVRQGMMRRVLLPGMSPSLADELRRVEPEAEQAGPRSDAARLAKALAGYFSPAGPGADLAGSLEWPAGTPFQLAVLRACAAIPRGTVLSYGELAAKAGFPNGARAAGSVMATNPLPLVIPCHRVVKAGALIGSFGGGVPMKRFLLECEGARVRG